MYVPIPDFKRNLCEEEKGGDTGDPSPHAKNANLLALDIAAPNNLLLKYKKTTLFVNNLEKENSIGSELSNRLSLGG